MRLQPHLEETISALNKYYDLVQVVTWKEDCRSRMLHWLLLTLENMDIIDGATGFKLVYVLFSRSDCKYRKGTLRRSEKTSGASSRHRNRYERDFKWLSATIRNAAECARRKNNIYPPKEEKLAKLKMLDIDSYIVKNSTK